MKKNKVQRMLIRYHFQQQPGGNYKSGEQIAEPWKSEKSKTTNITLILGNQARYRKYFFTHMMPDVFQERLAKQQVLAHTHNLHQEIVNLKSHTLKN